MQRDIEMGGRKYDDEGKRHISRSECVALNEMAEEISLTSNNDKKGE